MTDSIRQQIIDAIDIRFKTILVTGGYKTNIGQHVFDWLDRDLADSELDALIYRDKHNEITSESFDTCTNRLQAEIEIKTKSATTAEQVRLMAEDVYAAIGTDESWGGLALGTDPSSDDIDIQQADKIMGSGKIVIFINYEKARWGY
jgi:hypothetical protein